ncbi:hypothetical protein ABSL22_003299 [Escherichia coli]|uniref:hypothetical protein n=1 Tax=Escherichia coli TaxID=562 RepID=UPI0013C1A460|nr:hypothetical protein [Escherichia coli]EEY8720605.1 hypothetical protein [Escherichia coli]EEY9252485.1 hypothetical protein [Escherichia coli]EFC6490256.1 hypothetical protein [Escherichia coli]EFH5545015.1 hypothetical protein [Escherichia coli]EGK3599385.1 hypothetical protein [Escherichia coli]
MHRLVIAVFLFISSLASANAEGWYLTETGRPVVMSDDGNWYVFLERTSDGNANIYLTSRNFFKCSGSGVAQGMYVNGVKLRWYQNCDRTIGMYWYAYTKEGIKYIFGEFMRKDYVTIQNNDLVMRFSALGFNDKSRDFIDEIIDPGL